MIKDYRELEDTILKLNSFLAKEQGKRERILEQIEENKEDD